MQQITHWLVSIEPPNGYWLILLPMIGTSPKIPDWSNTGYFINENEKKNLNRLTILTMDKVFDQWFSNFFKQLDLCGINTKHFFKGVLCLISRRKKIQYI